MNRNWTLIGQLWNLFCRPFQSITHFARLNSKSLSKTKNRFPQDFDSALVTNLPALVQLACLGPTWYFWYVLIDKGNKSVVIKRFNLSFVFLFRRTKWKFRNGFKGQVKFFNYYRLVPFRPLLELLKLQHLIQVRTIYI
jgi:hypothetical protein